MVETIAWRTIVEVGRLLPGVGFEDVVTVLVSVIGTVTVSCSVTVTVEGGIDINSEDGWKLVSNSFWVGVFARGYKG